MQGTSSNKLIQDLGAGLSLCIFREDLQVIFTYSQGWQALKSLVWVLITVVPQSLSPWFSPRHLSQVSLRTSFHSRSTGIEYLELLFAVGTRPSPLRGQLTMSGGILGCHTWGGGKQKPGLLLNLLQRTRQQRPQQWRIIQGQRSIVPRLRDLGL